MLFYRSWLVRAPLIGTGCFLAWAFSVGPRQFRNTPSLRLLHHALPWPVIVAAFALYVALLLVRPLGCTLAADILGGCLYGVAFTALTVTYRLGRPFSPFAAAGLLLASMLHVMLAARLVIDRREQQADGQSKG